MTQWYIIPSFGLVLAVLALSVSGVVSAQKSANDNSPSNASTGKPCAMVHGAENSPFRFELKHPVRLSEAISLAGGAGPSATDVQVLHYQFLNCSPELKTLVAFNCIDCRLHYPIPQIDIFKLSETTGEDDHTNPYVKPGDILVIVDSDRVYVVGNVVSPQALVLSPGMTLAKAITAAGGLRRDANKRKVQITRRTAKLNQTELILVDLERIRKHLELDIVLRPYDIIEVLEKQYEEKWWKPSRSVAYRYAEPLDNLDWPNTMFRPQGIGPTRLKQ
ncbi:MAG TPA: SLBB domain-containing protein [Pyrinomonadaceae bacterium]|nr:SLBB domain-containing protein [Pyrinomonadaceae bacterium]